MRWRGRLRKSATVKRKETRRQEHCESCGSLRSVRGQWIFQVNLLQWLSALTAKFMGPRIRTTQNSIPSQSSEALDIRATSLQVIEEDSKNPHGTAFRFPFS